MQAIETKYIGPTNTKGSRIKAVCEAGSLTMEREYNLNIDDDHRRVASALILKLGWHGHWVQGGLPSGRGYAFVCGQRHGYDADKRLKEGVWRGPTEGFDVWPGMATA